MSQVDLHMLLRTFRSGSQELSEMKHSNLVKSVRDVDAGSAFTWADIASATV